MRDRWWVRVDVMVRVRARWWVRVDVMVRVRDRWSSIRSSCAVVIEGMHMCIEAMWIDGMCVRGHAHVHVHRGAFGCAHGR